MPITWTHGSYAAPTIVSTAARSADSASLIPMS